MMVLSTFALLDSNSSTKNANDSSNCADLGITEYLMLGLLGDSEMISGACIPNTRQIALRDVLVAVAVSAIT